MIPKLTYGVRLGGMMVCLLAPRIVPAATQVNYTVFPAKAGDTREQVTQPTRRRVTLVANDSTVKFIVNELARQAGLQATFVESPSLLKRISVHIVNLDVAEAFTDALRGTGLVAKLAADGETVVVRGKSGALTNGQGMVASGIIAGKVVDSASGQGVGGASVKVAGSTIAAVTSDSGRFILRDVPAGERVLMVRLFGYKPVERTVMVVDSERTAVTVAIVPVPTVLSGVVTTAVGQQQRYQVGNDITLLNADSIQKVAPVSTLTDMLETRVPGLIVQRTNGIPGAPSRLRLRGIGSVNMSSDPILIVDGIRVYADQSGSVAPNSPGSNGGNGGGLQTGGGGGVSYGLGNFVGPSALDQIDPNSIEKIEVLKGPSATAIYGSDAANGVIIITTKHGRVGPTYWSFVVDEGRTTLPSHWPINDYLFGHQPQWQNHSLDKLCGVFDGCIQDSLVAFQALNDPRYSPLTGASGHNQDASLTVSGGSGTMTYSLTGTATTQNSYLHLPPIEVERFQAFHGFAAPAWMRNPDQYTTYGGSSSLSILLGKRGGTLALTSSLFRSQQQQSSLQSDLATLSTTIIDTSVFGSAPLFNNYYTRALLRSTSFMNAVTLNGLAPWSWLPLTATAGLNVQDQNNSALLPRDIIICNNQLSQEKVCGISGSVSVNDTLGSFSLTQGTNTNGSLTVGTTIPSSRWINTAMGINVYTVTQTSFSASTVGLPLGVTTPTEFRYSNGEGPSYGSANQATYGWYVQPTLALSSRFFASPGFRLDGGSNSGTHSGVNNSALSIFPKLDFSWVAVERPPSNPLFGMLTLLRPRLAVGMAGIQPSPGEQFQLLQPAQVVPVTPGGAGTPLDALQLYTYGNPQLRPERDREVEGGADMQFWNQRLALSLTGSQKMSYDAILSIPVAPSVQVAGVTNSPVSITENVGTIRNTSLEATISARLVDSRLLDWSVNANVTKQSNLLVKLAPGLQSIGLAKSVPQFQYNESVTNRLVPGYPVFGLWTNPIIGFADVNHDGKIEPNEVVVGDTAVFIGAQQPNYEFTMGTTLNFFNDRLSVATSFDYRNGLTQVMPQSATLLLLNNPKLTLAQQAALSAALVGATESTPSSAIGLAQTVNTFRWNTIAITYLVPPTFAQKILRVPTLSVALQGSNLGLHTNYRGADPNVNAETSGNLTEDTGGLLPSPRVWNLRVTIGH